MLYRFLHHSRYTIWLPLSASRSILPLLLSCSFLWPFSASAWWETGHETVARLAAARLTPAARTRVAQILRIPETEVALADALAEASIWADHTKTGSNTAAWHYIDLALEDRKSDMAKRCERDNCAPARLRLFAGQLAAKTTAEETQWTDLDALRFLVHLAGDIHQPLHAASNADQGGNCERLDPPVGQAKTLHTLWDGEIVNSMGESKKTLAAELDREIASWTGKRQQALVAGDPDDWAWESHLLAVKFVYKRLHIPKQPVEFPAICSTAPAEIIARTWRIPRGYVEAMRSVVRLQLEKAGLRLARLLNESL
jgi:hypothetical protein